jgi:alpha-D-xyloside xylohydrolase
MKFSDGYWGVRDGVKLFSPVEVRDIDAANNVLTVFASCKAILGRGDTLNTPLLTLRFSSPLPDVIRVQITHFKGIPRRGPFFDTAAAEGFSPRIERAADAVSLVSGKTQVRIATRDAWAVEYLHDGRRMTGSGVRQTAYVMSPGGTAYMREQLSLAVGECVYGLGERFTHFVKNGQSVDIWNEDGGTCSEQAYKNVPFYITSAGYGILVGHPERVSFEIASEVVSRAQFSVPGERLEYYVIGGTEPKEVLRRYTALTGRPALPPAWSFGLWLSTSFTTDYNEATVNSFIDGMRDRGIPLHVFHFDCFWMKDFQWCDFQWDSVQFPDPVAILRRLKARGLRICAWINPYIAQKSILFDEGMSRGYLVKKPDGSVWQWDKWQAGMGLVDFTNEQAVRWYKDKLRRLLQEGVDCFKTDFGERIPTDVVYHDGADPQGMHNYYTYLYTRAVFELLEEERGSGDAVIFARSATTGSQKFPVHWGGDCSATYESMAESLRGGLSLGLSGFGFWSHDISGFEGTPTPDLYRRWTAFGLLSSHSRLHGNESYKVPWLFGEESSEVLRFFVQLKCRLMPYIFAAATEASREGIPVMRAMMLEFPNDPGCAYLDRQYMLGGSLLVAPIFNDEGSVTFYLPSGRWTSFLSGDRVDGGGWRTERHGYKSLPLMVRPNSIIALGSDETRPDYDFSDNVTFHLFELEEGKTATTIVSSGNEGLELRIQRKGRSLSVDARGARKPWRLCLRNVPGVESVTGGSARNGESGAVISPDALNGPISITLPAGRDDIRSR